MGFQFLTRFTWFGQNCAQPGGLRNGSEIFTRQGARILLNNLIWPAVTRSPIALSLLYTLSAEATNVRLMFELAL